MTYFALLVLAAQVAPGAQPGQPADPIESLLKGPLPLMIVMFVVLYVIMIRPQQKKAREHTELLKTLKPGDKVVTSGGVLGVIVSVKEKSVSLRSADTKLEVLKSAVSEITDRSSAAGQP